MNKDVHATISQVYYAEGASAIALYVDLKKGSDLWRFTGTNPAMNQMVVHGF